MANMPREVQIVVSPELSEEFAAGAKALAADATKKMDAGAALVYALYHHPRAQQLMTGEIGDVFWSNGLRKAYSQASAAYGIGAYPRDEEGEAVLPQPDPQEES